MATVWPGGDEGGGSARGSGGIWSSWWGITAVAVAQPVFNVVQQAPEELVNLAGGATDIVVFALSC